MVSSFMSCFVQSLKVLLYYSNPDTKFGYKLKTYSLESLFFLLKTLGCNSSWKFLIYGKWSHESTHIELMRSFCDLIVGFAFFILHLYHMQNWVTRVSVVEEFDLVEGWDGIFKITWLRCVREVWTVGSANGYCIMGINDA